MRARPGTLVSLFVALVCAAVSVVGCSPGERTTVSAPRQATTAPRFNEVTSGGAAPSTDGGVAATQVGQRAASPVASDIMSQVVDLGDCGDDWVSDLDNALAQVPPGAPPPQESWSCTGPTSSIGLTRWNDDAEVTTFFRVLGSSDRVAGFDLTQYSTLRLGGGIVVGAVDLATSTSNVDLLNALQQRLGGDIATYAELAEG